MVERTERSRFGNWDVSATHIQYTHYNGIGKSGIGKPVNTTFFMSFLS
jgi:hypothetical protein